jgi:hypothetical protein
VTDGYVAPWRSRGSAITDEEQLSSVPSKINNALNAGAATACISRASLLMRNEHYPLQAAM